MIGKVALMAILVAALAIGGAALYAANGPQDTSSGPVLVDTSEDAKTEDDSNDQTAATDDEGSEEVSIPVDTGEDTNAVNAGDLKITWESGSKDAYTITESNGEITVTFSGITEDTSYSVSGTLNGNIVIDAGDYDFELVLDGVTISSSNNVPISVISGDNAEISAKKGTTNYVYDNRTTVSDEDISASIYSKCDLKLKGKGKLVVVSTYNKGIHSKDDLEVKNLTLYVTCTDNALKGNDSVTITSGYIVLNATSGDGIKTSSTDLSSKGVQRGTVTVNTDDGDTSLQITAYCDGIDAAFDVVLAETSGSLSVTITSGVGASSSKTVSTGVTSASMGPSSGRPGQWGGSPGGNSWGQSGPDSDGNTNKADYSCKGVKAGNAVYIQSGTVTIDSFDDAIHANSEDEMESGVTPAGNVYISGGILTLSSKDDGIHADGTLEISGGTVRVTGSYEGLEGTYVRISGGSVSVISSDDGVNSTATSGTGIALTGGYLYVYSGGDGLDSNSRTSKQGIVFEGADVIVVSTSGGNSCIDTEAGYTYTSGIVLAVCPTGMTQEVTSYRPSESVAASGSISSGSILTVKEGSVVTAALKMPTSISNMFVIYMHSGSATLDAVSESEVTLNEDGAYILG